MTKYKAIIGLEMHCEITTTKSKVFSCAKNSYEINKEAVRKALMVSMILGCKQPEYLYFERKNYYYPDLPKGYQLTQETKPAPVGIYGKLKYYVNGEEKEALINNLHLEEDSASMEHFSDVSLIDYNRSGVPLLELVTEPCFHDADEVVAFLETMRSIYRYADFFMSLMLQVLFVCGIYLTRKKALENKTANRDEEDTDNFGNILACMNSVNLCMTYLILNGDIFNRLKSLFFYWVLLVIPYLIRKYFNDNVALKILVCTISIVYMWRLGVHDGDGVIPYQFFFKWEEILK